MKLPDEELLWEKFRTNRNIPPTRGALVFWYIAHRGYATQQDLCWELGMGLYELKIITDRLRRNGMLYTTRTGRPRSIKWRTIYGVTGAYFHFCLDCGRLYAVEPPGEWLRCPGCGNENVIYDTGDEDEGIQEEN